MASLVLARHDTRQVQLGGSNITLEVAHTEVAKEQGLSGRGAMASDHGMLFVFDSPAKYCFWMKGMRFNLDVIWLDSADRVVTVDYDLSPQTYPQTFCPNNPAHYVIEVNAGVAAAAHLATGQPLNIR